MPAREWAWYCRECCCASCQNRVSVSRNAMSRTCSTLQTQLTWKLHWRSQHDRSVFPFLHSHCFAMLLCPGYCECVQLSISWDLVQENCVYDCKQPESEPDHAGRCALADGSRPRQAWLAIVAELTLRQPLQHCVLQR